ncbi:COG4705 family protein [Burkholderia pseudomallei]
MNKLPAITLAFWVMKICATTLGETGGDLLSMTLDVGYAYSSLILFSFFIVTLAAQLAATRYRPAIYWAVIVATSTAGTTMSDFMDRTLGLGYAAGSGILVAILLSIFAVWRLQGESLAVTEIRTRKVEVLYWIAILFSNTLGTALGDFLADSSGLGFAGGAFLIGGLLAAIVLAAYFTKVSKVFLFWAAFVLTRPFGATVGDLLTKPVAKGGLGFGTVGSSAILAGVLVALVIYAMFAEAKRVKQARAPRMDWKQPALEE